VPLRYHQILTSAGMAKLETSGKTLHRIARLRESGDDGVAGAQLRRLRSKERERQCPTVASASSSGRRTNVTKEDSTGQPVTSVIGGFLLVLMPKSQFPP